MGRLKPQRIWGTQGIRNPGIPHSVLIPTGGGRTGVGERRQNPPTARATKRQVADGGNGTPRGGQQTVEPAATTDMAEDNCSAVPRQEQSDSADGARSEHGALARCNYDILASEATEGGQANAGTAGGEDSHGAS